MAIAEIDINQKTERAPRWESVFTRHLTPDIANSFTNAEQLSDEAIEARFFEREEWFEDEARLYRNLTTPRTKIRQLFTGLPPDLIVDALRSHEFYHRVGPEFLDELLSMPTAHRLANPRPIATASYGMSHPTYRQLFAGFHGPSFTAEGKQAMVDKVIENAPILPSALFHNLPEFLPEVVEALATSYRGDPSLFSRRPDVLRLTQHVLEYDTKASKVCRFIKVCRVIHEKEKQALANPGDMGKYSAWAKFLVSRAVRTD